MKAHINEIEITMAKTEKETLKLAGELADSHLPTNPEGHRQPREIRAWLSIVEIALRNDEIETGKRVDLLQLRQDLKYVVEGIGIADEKTDE